MVGSVIVVHLHDFGAAGVGEEAAILALLNQIVPEPRFAVAELPFGGVPVATDADHPVAGGRFFVIEFAINGADPPDPAILCSFTTRGAPFIEPVLVPIVPLSCFVDVGEQLL